MDTVEPGKIPDNAIIFLIYSADILGTEDEIEGMGPFRKAPDHGPYATPMPGDWVETEGDDQYDFGYLARECNSVDYCPAGYVDDEGLIKPQEGEAAGLGRHRKWVGYLMLPQWIAVAQMLCIDLDDNHMPERYEETMGSLTEVGLIPAIAIDNTDGWSPMNVISSQIYMSIGVPQDDDTPEAA